MGTNGVGTNGVVKTEQAEQDFQPITVTLSKLTEGVGMIFAGVLSMLESLDAGSARQLVDGFAKVTELTEDAAHKELEDKVPVATALRDATGPAASGDTPIDTAPTDAVCADGELKAEITAAQAKGGELESGITQDDITKIIVQKIKQNRSSNEKIGQLLKAYGAARVGELPISRYEAFITDLAAI